MIHPSVGKRADWGQWRRRAPFLIVVALVALGLVTLASPRAQAAPGTLDSSFGVAGVAVIGPIPFTQATGIAVRVQKDGKIVAAAQLVSGGDSDFAVWRFNPDGHPDTTFSGDGLALLDLPGAQNVAALALQPDGKIVLAGDGGGSTVDFMLARFNADGSPDLSFDGDGYALVDFGPGRNDHAEGVAVQKDGKIVAAGWTRSTGPPDFAVARVLDSGALDPGFAMPGGDPGRVITGFGPDAEDFGNAVVLQKDGKVVVAGSTFGGTDYDFALARYLPNGQLDPSFDGDGRVIAGSPGIDELPRALALQKDGKIVAAGLFSTGGPNDFAVARFRSDGRLDRAFGGPGDSPPRGWAVTDFGLGDTDEANGVAIQKDGKIVAVGFTQGATNSDFALARYLKNGRPDSAFGSAAGTPGRVTTDLGDAEVIHGVALQKNGRIVVVGYTNQALRTLVLARYLAR